MVYICVNCMRIFEQESFEDWPPRICDECGGDDFLPLSEYRDNELVNARESELEDERLFKENEKWNG